MIVPVTLDPGASVELGAVRRRVADEELAGDDDRPRDDARGAHEAGVDEAAVDFAVGRHQAGPDRCAAGDDTAVLGRAAVRDEAVFDPA